jgi:chromosome segregation ATPase
MADKELKEKYVRLRDRYESLSNAVQKLELENNRLIEETVYLKSQLETAQLQINQQKDNLTRVILTSNTTKDDMAAEIAELRAKIKRLGDGDIN